MLLLNNIQLTVNLMPKWHVFVVAFCYSLWLYFRVNGLVFSNYTVAIMSLVLGNKRWSLSVWLMQLILKQTVQKTIIYLGDLDEGHRNFFFNLQFHWGIITVKHCVSLRRITYWLDIFIYNNKVITTRALDNNSIPSHNYHFFFRVW